jgi:amino acid adenylation domain-containing protein
MNDLAKQGFKLSKQQAIRDKCFHPSGRFIEYPKEDVETSITERFEKIVGQFPGRLAVKIRNRTLTYQELNQAANRLAHAILAQRGEAQEPIALLMEHDSPLIVAIVAVLKADKICVILDPSFPKARSAFLLKDSQAGLLITDSKNLSLAIEYAQDRCRFLNIDKLDSGHSIDNPGLSIAPDHFAFLVYTSGSTGQPKGVIQNHRNLLHDSRLYCNGLHICTDDRVALLYSCSASQGLKITFATLLNGAVLYPFDVRREGVADLSLWLNQEEITIYFSIPMIFRQFVGTLAEQETFPRLRIIQLGSDLVTLKELEEYQKHFSADTILIIRFGTTETGTLRRMFFNVETPLGEATVPVGYASEDTDIVLLDDEGKEVKFDAVGEIVVKSRYVSPGYWRRPDLTREKFFSDPNDADKRIYHTGDLGRLRSDGLLYHLGRKDFQLKIRGYRVEAGEIEAVLLAQDNVKEAIVATGKASTGADSDRLIAYIVPFEKPLPSIPVLRRAAGMKLPAYMVPLDFVFLESLPLTPSGKVDRRSLPAPGNARPDLDVTYVVPQSDIEKQLAQIWEEMLDVHPIGIHDNFFDLGGHSLSATRLVSQVVKHFQLEIPLQSLFQSPTVSEMTTVITEHQERKLTKEHGGITGTTVCSLRPIPRDRESPFSFAQQRLWFLHQLEPDSPVYNQFKVLRLRGRLNREALQKALDTIVERHEVLRTTFSSVDDQLTHVIHEPGAVELSVIDLLGIVTEQREVALHRILSDFTHRPFDLEKAWPLRAALIQWADEEHVLVLVTHHIASDGWSNDILFRELSALYGAFCQGKGSPLKALPIQYADYAVWQKEWLQGEVLQQQLSYWKKRLDGISPLELPTDRPRPALQGHLGQTKTFTFPQALTEGLKNLSRQEDVTLFMTLLAAFQTLLHRYTAQDDIVVGSPIAGRNRVEVEGLIGFFVNTLVLRNNFSGDPIFRELLGRVRKNALDAYRHQDVPFEKLVEQLRPERDLSHNPFFQVIFQLRNYPTPAVSLGQLNIEEYEFGSNIAKFDLSVGLRDDVTGLTGSVEYRTDLFDPATIERMVGHFQTVLEGVVAKPGQPISELPLLTGRERHQLLVEWNDTKTEYPKGECIHELFEEQAVRTPGAIAVVFDEKVLTYQELNHRANQLAHYLCKLGVGPDVLVGICMERSMEMIVGLLGILKAGGAYVPLDPAYPKERLGFMLEDAQVGIVLTEVASLTSLLPTSARVICLERDWEEVGREPQDNPVNQSTADSLAYVIYTSGSTGVPKGVEVRHRGVVRLLFGVDCVRLDGTRTLLHMAPISFDAATFEVWGALLHGGKCVLFPGKVPSPRELGEVLKKHRVNTLWLTAASFNTVINEEPQALAEVKQLLIGGEALSVPHVRKGLVELPNTEIINGYGPTESATFTCCYPIPLQLDDNLSSIPIGKPIGNTQVFILDPHLNPVPIGIVGELHIGGDGLARGYLNRADLTAEKFIANPFSTDTSRLYKTGDLARYLPDGNIEFLGRIDNQVKIRGYRIELGEIEATLGQYPSIKESIVLVLEDSPGDRWLVAYVVAAAGCNASVTELRNFLQQRLPEYMVPSAFMFLESLPLTPNGKVDRGALPEPDRVRPELRGSYVAPRTSSEETLAGIWAELLKVDKVGVHDNFFELGGHSLLAIQVISRLRAAFGIELPLRMLFEQSTVAALTERIETLLWAGENYRASDKSDDGEEIEL